MLGGGSCLRGLMKNALFVSPRAAHGRAAKIMHCKCLILGVQGKPRLLCATLKQSRKDFFSNALDGLYFNAV